MKHLTVIVVVNVVAYLIVGYVLADFLWLSDIFSWKPVDRVALLIMAIMITVFAWGTWDLFAET